MHVTPETQLERFRTAIDLLGGTAAAARALELDEASVAGILTGDVALHAGFLRDISAALIRHADACRTLERQLFPAFAANLVKDQPTAPHSDAAQ